jgi:homoserine trans-succinylase
MYICTYIRNNMRKRLYICWYTGAMGGIVIMCQHCGVQISKKTCSQFSEQRTLHNMLLLLRNMLHLFCNKLHSQTAHPLVHCQNKQFT